MREKVSVVLIKYLSCAQTLFRSNDTAKVEDNKSGRLYVLKIITYGRNNVLNRGPSCSLLSEAVIFVTQEQQYASYPCSINSSRLNENQEIYEMTVVTLE